MAEWVKVEGLSYECHKLRIGRVIATATGECPAFEPGYSIEHDDAPYALEQESIDAAKAAAEQALREMHDALSQHFAPMLRWSDCMGSVDGLEHWALEIGQQPDDRWWWITSLGDAAADDGGNCASADDARRAAEAALRSLGVVFRTEGER